MKKIEYLLFCIYKKVKSKNPTHAKMRRETMRSHLAEEKMISAKVIEKRARIGCAQNF